MGQKVLEMRAGFDEWVLGNGLMRLLGLPRSVFNKRVNCGGYASMFKFLLFFARLCGSPIKERKEEHKTCRMLDGKLKRWVKISMIPLSDNFTLLAKPHLTDAELANSVVYALETFMPSDEKLQFPGIAIDVPKETHLIFVDREPMANWGHSCRYILLDCKSRKINSFEGRLPPFRKDDSLVWKVVYKAPSSPASPDEPEPK